MYKGMSSLVWWSMFNYSKLMTIDCMTRGHSRSHTIDEMIYIYII